MTRVLASRCQFVPFGPSCASACRGMRCGMRQRGYMQKKRGNHTTFFLVFNKHYYCVHRNSQRIAQIIENIPPANCGQCSKKQKKKKKKKTKVHQDWQEGEAGWQRNFGESRKRREGVVVEMIVSREGGVRSCPIQRSFRRPYTTPPQGMG